MNFSQVTKRQFELVMRREGVTVYNYYDYKQSYQVFFRRNERSSNPQSKLKLFYLQDCGLGVGSVFVLKGQPYLIISQDGIESDIYFTSMAMKCDAYFNIPYKDSPDTVYKIPFVVASDKFTVNRGTTVDLVNGSVVMYTGVHEYALDMKVDDYFENFGNAYKVGNRFTNNNIFYVYLEQDVFNSSENTYEGVFPSTPDDITDETPDDSDDTTTDPEEPTETTITYTITGGTTIRVGRIKTWVCNVVDADDNAIYGDAITWNVICDYEVTQTITEATSESYAQIKMTCDVEDAIDSTITLQALLDGNVVAALEITIQEAY